MRSVDIKVKVKDSFLSCMSDEQAQALEGLNLYLMHGLVGDYSLWSEIDGYYNRELIISKDDSIYPMVHNFFTMINFTESIEQK